MSPTGYGLGLVVTFIALWLLSGAQPALLYLVPFTLLPTMLTALIRGEFKALWSADSDRVSVESTPDSPIHHTVPGFPYIFR